MKKTIQITAGRGPNECQFVVAKVLKTLIKELGPEAIEYSVMNKIDGYENGTIQSVIIVLEGSGLDDFLKTWIGTVLWIGKSMYRNNHKRKNWFIEIFELTSNVVQQVNEKDFQFQFMRSKGAGGQHVNKVSSAVRATYPSYGITVSVMDTRSQHQNKKIAISRLKEKCALFQLEKLTTDTKNEWKNHLNIQRGNPIRVFKGSNFKKDKNSKTYKTQRNRLKNKLRLDMMNYTN